ncbi:MAG: tRNA (adenosine(37)-N6)-threonylcarbamoyltransferase complex ATPase subunit type 1 TsaE [Microthrixaceae bacterium]|nr:tRNA (adenosine(37)-N6)-threonylcarbamoyltransferase complex ATPase subunit type 1 TsaE [Microthrixaceae bacterium]
MVARTASVLETRDLAAALAELARPSDLLVLVGDLGAGKTAFTQGFGRGLGIDEQITSPTFALVRSYTGRLDLYHLDVYRLEQVSEALDLGLSELLDDGSVTVIEWGDTIAPALPHDYLEVHLRFDVPDGPAPTDESSAPATEAAAGAAAGSAEVFERRIVELRPIGPRWSARVRALGAALAPWTEGGAGNDADTGTGNDADTGERGAPTERDGVGEC